MTDYTLRISDTELDRYRMTGRSGSCLCDATATGLPEGEADVGETNILFGPIHTVIARRP